MRTLHLVIGAMGSGKTYHRLHDPKLNKIIAVDVWDYQLKAKTRYEVARSYVVWADAVIQRFINGAEEVVAEHTFFKRKRRVWFIKHLRRRMSDVRVVCHHVVHNGMLTRNELRDHFERPTKAEGYLKIIKVERKK